MRGFGSRGMGIIRRTKVEDDGAILIEALKSLRKNVSFLSKAYKAHTFSAVTILFQGHK